jgi:hypothetical protein
MLRRLLKLRELGTLVDASPRSFAAAGKSLDLSMVVASLGKLVARARTDIAERVGILGTTLKQSTSEGS